MSQPTDRNRFPLLTPDPVSKKQEEDRRWSKAHGESRVKIDDMAVDRILEEQTKEIWEVE